MTRPTITITNAFTGRETRVFAKPGDCLSPAKCRRIKRRLQASDCLSGGVLGERGPQSFIYDHTEEGGVLIIAAAPYDITIACDHAEGEEFAAWLNVQGHRAKIGRDTGNYIDGIRTSASPVASDIMRSLWEAYGNA
jgi:hypothetical protein